MNPEKIFIDNQGLLFKTIFEMMKDYEDSRDMMQDVFLRLRRSLEKGQTFDSREGCLIWLCHVSRNMVRDEFRRRKRSQDLRLFDFIEPLTTKDPEGELIVKQGLERAEEAIKNLHWRQKEVFDMRNEGLKFSEISKKTGRSLGAVIGDFRYSKINIKKTL